MIRSAQLWVTLFWVASLLNSFAAGAPNLDAFLRSETQATANRWVRDRVPYNQGAYYNGYRQDCSGFASMCWDIRDVFGKPVSLVTGTLRDATDVIGKGELKSGDALLNATATNRNNQHIVLFDKWANSQKTVYWGWEETVNPGRAVYRQIPYPYFAGYETEKYVPVRFRGITDDIVQPLWRYWNPDIAKHHYTDLFRELQTGKYGYVLEKTEGNIYVIQMPGTTPLYRYYHPPTGGHFLTTNWDELGGGRGDWVYEGIQGYAYGSPVPGTLPLYRWYKGNTNDHFYTVLCMDERYMNSIGYASEGIACYVRG
jgi:predicted nucleic acid-binding protein